MCIYSPEFSNHAMLDVEINKDGFVEMMMMMIIDLFVICHSRARRVER
jgi:hypothetical protein